jgi:hypothetical protein
MVGEGGGKAVGWSLLGGQVEESERKKSHKTRASEDAQTIAPRPSKERCNGEGESAVYPRNRERETGAVYPRKQKGERRVVANGWRWVVQPSQNKSAQTTPPSTPYITLRAANNDGIRKTV